MKTDLEKHSFFKKEHHRYLSWNVRKGKPQCFSLCRCPTEVPAWPCALPSSRRLLIELIFPFSGGWFLYLDNPSFPILTHEAHWPGKLMVHILSADVQNPDPTGHRH